jgi:hypothetical protein
MRYVEEARIYADRNEGVHAITLDCLPMIHLTYESFAQTRFFENIIFDYRDVYRN